MQSHKHTKLWKFMLQVVTADKYISNDMNRTENIYCMLFFKWCSQ